MACVGWTRSATPQLRDPCRCRCAMGVGSSCCHAQHTNTRAHAHTDMRAPEHTRARRLEDRPRKREDRCGAARTCDAPCAAHSAPSLPTHTPPPPRRRAPRAPRPRHRRPPSWPPRSRVARRGWSERRGAGFTGWISTQHPQVHTYTTDMD
eukprot:2917557-Rhodomonas_salina.1